MIPQIREIANQIMENRKKLDLCEGPHDFQHTDKERRPPLGHWTCSKCGGWQDYIQVAWYQKGLEHGRKIEK